MPDDLPNALEEGAISDAELAAEAMDADPDAPIDDDAVPFDSGLATGMALLPEWYMPAPSLRRSPGKVFVLAGIAATLALGNVVGMCVTYGFPEFVFN
jgi:hypothetical protein